jgi:hypothetical protein
MPTVSIDTFFACTIIVSVAIIAMAFVAGTMQTQIGSMQDLNKQDYLRALADRLVLGCGVPDDWGSSGSLPSSFGLSTAGGSGFFVLDADKVSRLNSQNTYALSYPQLLSAANLENIALSVSVSSIFNVAIALDGNTTVGDETTYNFTVSTSQDAGPMCALLSCYLVTGGGLVHEQGATSALGTGNVSFALPTSEVEPAALVVFARSSIDDRMTACSVYVFDPFMSPSDDAPLALSVLNGTLSAESLLPEVSIANVYALTYNYNSTLSPSTPDYVVPAFVDPSPIILIVQGTNASASFLQWTAYPQVPLTLGADFSQSTINAFTYTVTINGVLYKLTLNFGDVFK